MIAYLAYHCSKNHTPLRLSLTSVDQHFVGFYETLADTQSSDCIKEFRWTKCLRKDISLLVIGATFEQRESPVSLTITSLLAEHFVEGSYVYLLGPANISHGRGISLVDRYNAGGVVLVHVHINGPAEDHAQQGLSRNGFL